MPFKPNNHRGFLLSSLQISNTTGYKSPNTETVKMLLTKWVCPDWSVIIMHKIAFSPFLGGYLLCRFKCHVDKFWTCVSGEFWDTGHPVLISFPFLQFPRLFWTWSTTTMAPPGDRPWDAQQKGHLFPISSGWFARILRSMETRCFFSMCGQNVSSLIGRTSNAFSFSCWSFSCFFFFVVVIVVFCICDSYLA